MFVVDLDVSARVPIAVMKDDGAIKINDMRSPRCPSIGWIQRKLDMDSASPRE